MGSYARWHEAEQKTEEVSDTAREVQRKLEPFARTPDPFGALMVNLYNRRIEIIEERQAEAR